MSNVIHAEMLFNNQRANAEIAREYGSPRENWPAVTEDENEIFGYELTFNGYDVTIGIPDLIQFVSGNIGLEEIDDVDLVMGAIVVDWLRRVQRDG